MKNIVSIFRDWGIDQSVSREKISVWAHDWDMRLDQPTTESPKQGNTVFDIFSKTRDFPKIAKTLKNIFVFDQQGLSM